MERHREKGKVLQADRTAQTKAWQESETWFTGPESFSHDLVQQFNSHRDAVNIQFKKKKAHTTKDRSVLPLFKNNNC